jgi:hypothetical protein
MAGLLIGFAAAVVLALLYPLPTTAPAIGDASLAAPGEPAAPGRALRPEPPASQTLIRGDAPRPLVELPEAADAPPAGSPSLVPGAD